jgi:ABC-type amino acid transport substrate-binding protein
MVYNRAAVARFAKGKSPQLALRSFSGRIGVIRASTYVEFAKESFPKATIVEVKDWNDGIRALRDQTIDGLYRDEFEVRRVIVRYPEMGVQFGTAIFTDKVDLKVIYICNSCANLQQAVNFYINSNEKALAELFSIDALMRNARK